MVTKKVVLINGSPRKGTTLKYLREIEELLNREGITTDLISCADCEITYCTGCEQCIRKTSWCVYRDDATHILTEVLEADGLVFGSPVYVGTVTGKMKSLIDKTASWLHRPPAVGMPVLPVVTTAGSGEKRTLDYLKETVMYWGAHPLEGIVRTASKSGPIRASELAPFIRHLHLSKQRYKPTLRQIMLFQVQKVLALKVARIDRAFWEEKGWDKMDYYYPCRISLTKRMLGRFLFGLLFRRINPAHPF